MRSFTLSVPDLMFLVSTRALLGAGVGLLLAERFGRDERRAIGWTLAAVGAVTTLPAVLALFASRGPAKEPRPELAQASGI